MQQCGMHNDAGFHPSLVDTSIKQKQNIKIHFLIYKVICTESL